MAKTRMQGVVQPIFVDDPLFLAGPGFGDLSDALGTFGGTHDLASKIVVARLISERGRRKREIGDENGFADLGFAAAKIFFGRRQIPGLRGSPLI
ncbi:MAG: hypothetical protein H6Q05_3234 [Acidobacteria bacterium]|jgi:hypothetical protein|nr:hypothetical protein [Acidobacteriota bacterium]